MDVEDLPFWVIKLIEDDPEDVEKSLITLTLESDPKSWMKVRIAKADATDLEVGTKAQYANVSEEIN